MTTHLNFDRVKPKRLDPLKAELDVFVTFEGPRPDDEIRGRLVGPRCAYANTVEVSYPLCELARGEIDGCCDPPTEGVDLRAVIPEPNAWEPQTPFLYHCFAELWREKKRQVQADLWCGLRTFTWGAKGLHINGHPISLWGRRRSRCTEAEAQTWHDQGLNLLVAPVAGKTEKIWELGSRLGFCVLGRLENADERFFLRPRMNQASALGWIVPASEIDDLLIYPSLRWLSTGSNHLLGVELEEPLDIPVLKEFDFVLCRQKALPALTEICLPKMVLVDTMPDEKERCAALKKGIVAWIQS